MTEEMQEIVMIAALIDIPWEAAKEFAICAHKSKCPTMKDILQTRAKLRLMETEAIIAEAQQMKINLAE